MFYVVRIVITCYYMQVVLVDAASGAEVLVDTYDTVLFGAGRQADTATLGLDTAGVTVLPSGKIPVVDETTNVPHIHALGKLHALKCCTTLHRFVQCV
jgi:pyruvate/2-oxoglutarate dehydrogenase complex dihydrolipoamide dehydrogenase (E3) component